MLRKFFSILLLACFLLAGCSEKALIEKYLPKDDDAFARQFLEFLRTGDYTAADKMLETSKRGKGNAGFRALNAGLAHSEQLSIKPIGFYHKMNFSTATGNVKTTRMSYQIHFADETWAAGFVLIQHKADETSIIDAQFTPLSESLESLNRFTFSGKSVVHFLVFLVCIAVPVFIIYTLVVCIRTPMSRRKWLWIILVLFGVVQIQFNWTSGEFGLQLCSFWLAFGSNMFRGSIYDPWTLSFGVPVGAIIFLALRRKLNTLDKTESQPPLPFNETMNNLTAQIETAARAGKLLADSEKNLLAFLAMQPAAHDVAAIVELVDAENWTELDNRFFRTLAFGTGGLRGKSVGAVLTEAERGKPQPLGHPEFPCTGTNAMNYFNVSRATQGLVAYVKKQYSHLGKRPAICIAHDTRFFSREFAELAAKVIADLGCDAYLFESYRSTPELSFAVRLLRAQAGINITASHNPREYNGYKVYDDNGCQVVEPHASAIIECVNSVAGERYTPMDDHGRVVAIGAEVDKAYIERLLAVPVEPEAFNSNYPSRSPLCSLGRSPSINSVGQRPTNDTPQNHKPCKGEINEAQIPPLQGYDDFSSDEGRCPSLLIEGLRPNGLKNEFHVVYTPLHGTGVVIIKPLFEQLGIRTTLVAEQCIPDGNFPTVKSPNPENGEALSLGIALAEKEGADIVIATDPDGDRMGVAARDTDGRFVLLSGNEAGAIMCWHRITRHFAAGILDASNVAHATVVKTLVTTDLEKAIAQKHGVACVETLTGFKYIGEKLGKYETLIPADLRTNYRDLAPEKVRALLLTHSKYYVFGGEESYGYSSGDFVRDKDANCAALMIAEAAVYARSQGLTLVTLLDKIHCDYGYYHERSESLTMDGAEGAAQIRRIVASYAAEPPKQIGGVAVDAVVDYAQGGIKDSEGDELPRESMLMLHFADGSHIAVRPSGTEPKIKFYLFAKRDPGFVPAELPTIKQQTIDALDTLWKGLKADVQARMG